MPHWLPIISYLYLTICIICAGIIIFDELICRSQKMYIMYLVWPVNTLYLGPITLWAYYSFGRPVVQKMPVEKQPFWKIIFKAVNHCGAGCTLGDIIAETTIFLLGITLLGKQIWAELIGDFILAYVLGIVFQYFTIAPMRGLRLKDGIIAAIKADTLSLSAFEVGLFVWMLLMAFVFFHPPVHPDSVVYWFMMQIGMTIGFLTSYPMNWWLVKKGLKEKM